MVVECELCGKQFRSSQNLKVHKKFKHEGEFTTPVTISDETRQQPVAVEKTQIIETAAPTRTANYETHSEKSVLLSGRDQALIEILANKGIGSSLSDVIRKSLYFTANAFNIGAIGGEDMDARTESPEKTLDKLQSREATQAFIEKLKKEGTSDEDIETILTKQLKLKSLTTALEGKRESISDTLKELVVLNAMQRMTIGQDSAGSDPKYEMLMKKIERMEDDRKFESLRAEQDRKLDALSDVIKTSYKKEDQSTVLKEIEKIRAESQKDLKELEIKNQNLRDEFIKDTMKRLEQKVEAAAADRGWDREVTDSIKKDFGVAFTEQVKQGLKTMKGEKTGTEVAQELITNTIEQVREPLLAPIGQALSEKIKGARQAESSLAEVARLRAAVQEQQTPTPQATPPAKIVKPPEEDFSDLVQISG